MQMSYVDGFCYVALERTFQLYRSSDFENWEEVGTNRGVPLSVGGKTLWRYFNYSVVNNAAHLTALPILDSNGHEDSHVALEVGAFANLYAVGDYFFAIDVQPYPYANPTTSSTLAESALRRTRPISYSKDGVYWATLLPPREDGAVTEVFKVGDNYVLNNGDVGRTSYSAADLEAALPADPPIYVEYNNTILGFETPPTLDSDRTLVPMRFLFEQMGADVNWDGATQTATVEKEAQNVSFSIGSKAATVNGKQELMDVPAKLVNDRTMVPLRFLSEELGYTVEWDAVNRVAKIISE
jgi:hypothetical protein